jgi:hypothetical protein
MNEFFEQRSSASPFVKMVWKAAFESDGELSVTADGTWDVVFGTFKGETRCVITGPTTRTDSYPYSAGQQALGIQFREGSYLVGLPAREVVNATRALERRSGTFTLAGYRFEVPEFDFVEDFVGRLRDLGILRWDPLVPTALEDKLPAMPARTVQRHFSETTGIPLGRHQQIKRAQRAAQLLRDGMKISSVVHECGYFDQAHLTRSLKEFLGKTPGQLGREAIE